MERRGKNDPSSLLPPTSGQSTSSQQQQQHLSKTVSERDRLIGIQKRWTYREENEFLRVLTGYGVDLMAGTNCPTPDWHRFKAMAKLEKKSDDALSDYYKVFIAMCKRKAGVRLTDDEKEVDGIIDDISEDHARLILDRLELLSKLREVVNHSRVEERLTLCNNNYDTPDWWESGHHDRELIRAVLKHGLYRSEYYIFNDPTYSFGKSEQMFLEEVESHLIKAQLAESEAAEILRLRTAAIKREKAESEAEVASKSVKNENEEEDLVIVKSEKPIVVIDEIVIKDDDSDNEVKEKKKTNSEVNLAEKTENIDETIEKQCEENKSAPVDEETHAKSSKCIKDVSDESNHGDKGDMEVDSVAIADGDEKSQDKDVNTLLRVDEDKVDMETSEEPDAELPKVIEDEIVNEPDTKQTPIKTESSEEPTDVTAEKKESSEEAPMVVDEEEKEPKLIEGDISTEPVADETDETLKLKPKSEVTNKEELAVELTTSGDPDDDDVMKEKEKAVEEECKKQAADLKARFPDLEVIQPLSKSKSTVDMKILKGKNNIIDYIIHSVITG